MPTPALLAAASSSAAAPLGLILAIVAVALVFDFLNGFHDAANSIATVVSTRVLSPVQAVVWAAFFNFVAAFVLGTTVAGVIAKGLVRADAVDIYVVLAGLAGAIIWNVITWLLALPTSSSHALMSGVAGAAIARAGVHVLIFEGWKWILIFLVLSPVIGMVLGALNMIAVAWIFRRATPYKVDRLFRRLQLASAAVYSLGHGGNDAQKTMGIIVLLLSAGGKSVWAAPVHGGWFERTCGIFHHSGTNFNTIAPWIILSCYTAISLGTIFGGWRIVKTVGSSITRLQPVGGFCAELSAATTIIGATFGHIAISTTHAITGAILGVGTTRGVRSVRWIWGQRIVMAWILTIPCSAFIAGIIYALLHLLGR